ncbi:hypothetical protein ACET3Z_003421 [Daucus carota]
MPGIFLEKWPDIYVYILFRISQGVFLLFRLMPRFMSTYVYVGQLNKLGFRAGVKYFTAGSISKVPESKGFKASPLQISTEFRDVSVGQSGLILSADHLSQDSPSLAPYRPLHAHIENLTTFWILNCFRMSLDYRLWVIILKGSVRFRALDGLKHLFEMGELEAVKELHVKATSALAPE